jgi:hypothetical protein
MLLLHTVVTYNVTVTTVCKTDVTAMNIPENKATFKKEATRGMDHLSNQDATTEVMVVGILSNVPTTFP